MPPVGIPGELCIAGPGVTRGYLNNPELTNFKFQIPNHTPPAGGPSSNTPLPLYPSTPFYRTGDLTRWLPDGNIEFLGRIDQQVKIRGFRIEPGEIETRLMGIAAIVEAVVLPREDEQGDKYLCAYLVLEPGEKLDTPQIREYLLKIMPNYMVPSYFVVMDILPLTPNGKVDRRALPEPAAGESPAYTAPRNQTEEKLAAVWNEVLSKDRRIGIDDNFFNLGGHSLKAMVLISKLHKVVGIKISLSDFFQTPTIRGLSDYLLLETKKSNRYASIKPAEKKDYYVVSSAQKRLYMLQKLGRENISYNLPGIFEINAEMNRDRIEHVFRRLVHRHESFRTSFRIIDGKPVQRIHDEVEFEITYYNLATLKNESAIEPNDTYTEFIRPFDLEKAPLLRVGLVESGKGKHLLMVDMHHIVSDGTSVDILTKEVLTLYREMELPAPRLQYKDYSEWQDRQKETEAIKSQEIFWLKQYEGEIPVLNLNTDFQRNSRHNSVGDTIFFDIDKRVTEKLKENAAQTGSTLYIILLAALNILLFKYTGQEDIVVGTPVMGRPHDDLQSIIGMFINMLPVRNRPRGNKTIRGFLSEVKTNALDAYENQDYPFDELVEKLDLQREPGKHPLVNTVIVLQNFTISSYETTEFEILPNRNKYEESKFDLSFNAVENENSGTINMHLQYSTTLYKHSTAEKMTQRYLEILTHMAENLDTKLQDIAITHDFLTADVDVIDNLDVEFGF